MFVILTWFARFASLTKYARLICFRNYARFANLTMFARLTSFASWSSLSIWPSWPTLPGFPGWPNLSGLPGLPDWLALLVWPICQVGRVCQACQVCQISQGARLGQARFWFYAENYRNDHQQLSNKNTLQCYRRPKTREPSVGIFYILGWLSVPPRRALFEQGSIWRLNYLHTFFSKCISVHVR